MKISAIDTVSSVISADASNNSHLIINYAPDNATNHLTYKVTLRNAGKAIANDMGLLTYNSTNKELLKYKITSNAFATEAIGQFINSDDRAVLTGAVTNVSYDTVAKKITKTVYGITTTDVVSAATLKTDMALNNVENKSSATIRSELTSNNVTTALGYTPLNNALKGANSGVAELDASGKVPSSQLPSYVDDVIEGYFYNNGFYKEAAHTTAITGESGKIYVDLGGGRQVYRWSGSAFAEIPIGLALGETQSTAYRGDYGAAAYAAAVTNVDSAPTASSTNLVTSGGVASAISDFYTKPSGGIPSTDLASGVIPDLTNYALKETIETISSTTPSITGVANTVYKCGEVTTISITPPQSGTIDVIFTSGTTAATLTVPNTVKFPDWFDPTDLEADTIYEINIMDGVYGVVALWQ